MRKRAADLIPCQLSVEMVVYDMVRRLNASYAIIEHNCLTSLAPLSRFPPPSLLFSLKRAARPEMECGCPIRSRHLPTGTCDTRRPIDCVEAGIADE